MAGSLNSGFTNNKNTISLGRGSNVDLYTDRAIAASANDPDGAAARDKINSTSINQLTPTTANVFSSPGSGHFNAL